MTFHGADYYNVPYLKRKSKHAQFLPKVATKRVFIKTQEEFNKYFGGEKK